MIPDVQQLFYALIFKSCLPLPAVDITLTNHLAADLVKLFPDVRTSVFEEKRFIIPVITGTFIFTDKPHCSGIRRQLRDKEDHLLTLPKRSLHEIKGIFKHFRCLLFLRLKI